MIVTRTLQPSTKDHPMFTLFIGTERNAAGESIRPLLRRKAIQEIKREALDRFGGYSASIVFGGWRDVSGCIVEEKTLRLEISASDYDFGGLVNFAGFCAKILHQTSVLLVSPGRPDKFVTFNPQPATTP